VIGMIGLVSPVHVVLVAVTVPMPVPVPHGPVRNGLPEPPGDDGTLLFDCDADGTELEAIEDQLP
jgi:hypothetical protein